MRCEGRLAMVGMRHNLALKQWSHKPLALTKQLQPNSSPTEQTSLKLHSPLIASQNYHILTKTLNTDKSIRLLPLVFFTLRIGLCFRLLFLAIFTVEWRDVSKSTHKIGINVGVCDVNWGLTELNKTDSHFPLWYPKALMHWTELRAERRHLNLNDCLALNTTHWMPFPKPSHLWLH